MARWIFRTLSRTVQYVQLPILFVSVFLMRLYPKRSPSHQRCVTFGGVGIINFARWSHALRKAGIPTRTVVWSTPQIYGQNTFSLDLNQKYGSLAGIYAPVVFIRELAKTDTVVHGFDGFLLGLGYLRRFESVLIRISRRKTIVVPYGADAFVYSKVHLETLAHVLQISYPDAARKQKSITRDVERHVKNADFMFCGMMTFDGIGRWDALPFNCLVVDLDSWKPGPREWLSGPLKVVHAPNHRGFKGTEFLVAAVERLQTEGESIELILLEGVPNESVREIFSNSAHVLVEQLIAPGYAMNGVEGLASGLVVLANLDDERVMTPMRRWSTAGECPIISASPETIYRRLKDLLGDRGGLSGISQKSREYAEKFHCDEAFVEFYKAIDAYLWADGKGLINFFHPLLGSFRKGHEPPALYP
jgi:hypothetical protein